MSAKRSGLAELVRNSRSTVFQVSCKTNVTSCSLILFLLPHSSAEETPCNWSGRPVCDGGRLGIEEGKF